MHEFNVRDVYEFCSKQTTPKAGWRIELKNFTATMQELTGDDIMFKINKLLVRHKNPLRIALPYLGAIFVL